VMLMPEESKADAISQSQPESDSYEITIVGDREHAPFEFIDVDGTPSGYLVDVIEHILQKKNINYKIRLRNHAKALSSIDNNEADIILLVFNVYEDSTLYLSRPLHRIHAVAVCDNKLPTVTLNTLKDYKVVVLDKSFIIPEVEQYIPEENRIYVDNVLDAMRLVQNDKYDVALVTSAAARHYMQNNNFSNINIQDIDLSSHSVRIGVNKNHPELLKVINEGIEEALKDGSYDHIYKKWFGSTADTEEKYPEEIVYVFIIGGILFVAMIIIIFYTLIQTKRIRRFSSSETNKGQFYKSQTSMLLDAVPVGVAIYDGEGKLKYVNSTLAEMFSIKDAKEYVRARHSIYDNPLISDRNKVRIRMGEDFDFMLTYTSDLDARYKYAFVPEEDTAYFECKIRHVKSPNQDYGNSIYFVLNDITTLQVTRKNIENQTNCLNLALGAGNLRVWSCDIATSMIYKQFDTENNESEEQETIAYRDFLKTIHPDDLSIFLDAWDNLLSLRSEEEDVTIRILNEEGVYGELSIKMKVMFESTGRRSQTMRILMVSRK
ncbi:MAG: transporter substrate-binding domain-containing protein, partial [Muribaculaceae bacterium]|nr:transporter substrate-binding domain-containing protein [Muribaculaceae bacterium]